MAWSLLEGEGDNGCPLGLLVSVVFLRCVEHPQGGRKAGPGVSNLVDGALPPNQVAPFSLGAGHLHGDEGLACVERHLFAHLGKGELSGSELAHGGLSVGGDFDQMVELERTHAHGLAVERFVGAGLFVHGVAVDEGVAYIKATE